MKGSRTKMSLGVAILILVGGMLTDPPDAILYSLGTVGAFILIWGIRPDWISWLLSRLHNVTGG